jgi:adenylate kinase
MGIALIMGVPESSKDAIMDVLVREKDVEFEYGALNPTSKMQLRNITKDLEKTVAEKLKISGNIVVNIPVSLETVQGFVPVLNADFFEIVKPDVIILVEDMPS